MGIDSHKSASRISAMWKAHKAQEHERNLFFSRAVDLIKPLGSIDRPPDWIGIDHASGPDKHVEAEYEIGPDRNILLRRIRELPPLTKLQQAD